MYEETALYRAIEYLGKKRGIKVCDFSALKEMGFENPSIEDIARISGFSCREVMLNPDWPKRKYEPVLLFFGEEETPAVVDTDVFGRARMYDGAKNTTRILRRAEMEILPKTGYVAGKSLGFGEVKGKDILKFALKEISPVDVFMLILAMLFATLVSLSVTHLSQMIYSTIIPTGNIAEIYGVGGIFLSALVAGILFSLMQNLTQYRITSKIHYNLQAAVYDRAFRLPENFYRDKDSGEQAFRIDNLSATYVMIIQNAITILLQTAFSLFYCVRMLRISVELSLIGFAVTLIGIIISVIASALLRKISRRRALMTGKMRAYLYQVISGITTVRVSGSEKNATEKYMEQRSAIAAADYRMARLKSLQVACSALINILGMTLMYSLLGGGTLQLQGGSFVGFLSANTYLATSMTTVSSAVVLIVTMLPMIKDSSEFLRCLPERNDTGKVIPDFHGEITLKDVSFSYPESERQVLKDISLHIAPGEYVGIVGKSGCGKSTLLRLLLGFDKPTDGKILYDNVDMDELNLPELRRRIGAVLQDGCLFSGSIYKNIRIASPNASDEDIANAVETAAFADDIKEMPMGLQTFVSEEAQTLSGGQKQKLLIARAIVGKPGILLMDEATSALDNLSQEKVSDNLKKLTVTRIVVAHRLSTVKKCDRILLLDEGGIAEEGTYEELMEKKGKFYEMAVKQVV